MGRYPRIDQQPGDGRDAAEDFPIGDPQMVEVARLAALGYETGKIAVDLELSTTQISIHKGDLQYDQALRFWRSHPKDAAKPTLLAMVGKSLRTLQTIQEAEDAPRHARARIQAAKVILQSAGLLEKDSKQRKTMPHMRVDGVKMTKSERSPEEMNKMSEVVHGGGR